MAQEVFYCHVQIGHQCGHRLSFQVSVRSAFDLHCPSPLHCTEADALEADERFELKDRTPTKFPSIFFLQ